MTPASPPLAAALKATPTLAPFDGRDVMLVRRGPRLFAHASGKVVEFARMTSRQKSGLLNGP